MWIDAGPQARIRGEVTPLAMPSLWGQPSGQEKQQLLAESQTKFFLKAADVQVTFQKDAKGNVVGLLMDQAGRPQRELKKVK